MSADNIRIILHQPSHPGNIGAVARAMWTMNLSQLTLVQPRLFPDPAASARASGAQPILAQAQVVDDLDTALADCQVIYATSAQSRHLPWPQLTPKEAAKQISQAPQQQRIAILFGPERTGLENEDLQRAHHQIAIPANPTYSSLNLAMAVQVITYEIFCARLQSADAGIPLAEPRDLATDAQMQGFFQHLEAVLAGVSFQKPTSSPNLMPKLKRLFNRAELDQDEINLLRGLFKAILLKAN